LTTAQRVTNALGHRSSTDLDPAWGLARRQTDPNQRITSLRYDGLGRLVKVWQPGRSEAAGDSPHVQYSYGLRRSEGPNWVRTQALAPNGNQVTSYTLLDGFLRERQRQAPSPQGGRVLTDTLYNSRGLPVVHRPALYDATGGPGTELKNVTAGGAVPNATVTVYDGAERKTDEIYLEKNVEQWRTKTVYGGTNVSVIPPPGGTVTTVWSDARDRVTARVQWHGRELAGANDVTRYDYTKRGDLAKLTDAAGNVWRYEYDVLGRRVRADDPDKGISTMSYDDAGQLRSATDARNKTLAMLYDVLGRPTETRLGSDTGTLLTRKVYDSLAKGAPTSSTRYSGGAEYTRSVTGYDMAGRPTGESLSIPAKEGKLAGEYSTSHTYAADGSPLATTLPPLGAGAPGGLAKETLSFSYDSLGLADRVTGAQAYVAATKRTALGEVAQVAFGAAGNNLWRSAYYEDGTRRLSRVLTTSLAPDGAFVHDFGYRYDPAGNVTRIADRTAGSTPDVQCFRHDYLRRTTTAWTAADPDADCATDPTTAGVGGPAPSWQQFGYDLTGNRTSRTVKGLAGGADVTSTYGYPAAGDGVDRPHAVTSVVTGPTTASYDYDQAGNLLHRPAPGGGRQTLSWDDQGLLASISSTAGETSYVYDADGTQLIRRDPGSTTLFAGNDELTVDTATQKVRATRYYDGIGVRTASGLVWTESDHHGTAQVAIDPTTLKPTTRRLDLFGNPRGGAAAWPAGDRGFVGGTTNAGTGLTRLGAREYEPELGRFISVDPVIDPNDPQQLNAYAYSNNNPASMADPDGQFYYVDLDGRVTAPPAAGQTKRVMQRVNHKIKRLAHNYDKKRQRNRPSWPKYYENLVKNPKAAPNAPWGAPHALLWPLIPSGPEGDPARERLQQQSAADADQAARHHAQQMAEQEDTGGGGLLDWIGPSDDMISAGMSARSAVSSFVHTPFGRWVVHLGVSVGIGVGAGLLAGAVCGFTLFVGCALAVGVTTGVVASGPAHIGVAELMGEEYTSADVIKWSVQGAFGGGINAVLRGVVSTSPIGLGVGGAMPGISVPLQLARTYLLNPSLWLIK
jgi:RHS repeat-associated protein